MNTFAIGSLPVHFSVAKLFNFRWQYTLCANDNIIVVSHHLPSQILVSDRFKGSKLNDAFSSEQGQWIADSKIAYWIYGHSHTNFPDKIGDTKFLSNQLGYVYAFPEATDFDKAAYIEV